MIIDGEWNWWRSCHIVGVAITSIEVSVSATTVFVTQSFLPLPFTQSFNLIIQNHSRNPYTIVTIVIVSDLDNFIVNSDVSIAIPVNKVSSWYWNSLLYLEPPWRWRKSDHCVLFHWTIWHWRVNHVIIPRRTLLRHKLRKFPQTRIFIAVFTRTRCWCYIGPSETSLHLNFIRLILILSSYLRLLPIGLFLLSFLTTILCALLMLIFSTNLTSNVDKLRRVYRRRREQCVCVRKVFCYGSLRNWIGSITEMKWDRLMVFDKWGLGKSEVVEAFSIQENVYELK